jgi:hypothetical protein
VSDPSSPTTDPTLDPDPATGPVTADAVDSEANPADELEQERPVDPEDDDPPELAGEIDAPLGDQKAAAAEADLVEQHQAVPGDDDRDGYDR